MRLDLSKLFGAVGLASAGGVVTVLGIVFLFVLAVNRGWINAELRLAFGAAASVGIFAAGVLLRRRFGASHAALAAVGAGIAGGFATLLPATAFYEFVPEPWALVAAGGIASAATAVAVAWRAELVAALGLVGALLVPLMAVVEDGELALVGTAFVAVVFAGTAEVARRMGWTALLVAGLVASYPQVAGLAGQADATDWAVVGVVAVYWSLLVAVVATRQVAAGPERIESLAGTLLLAAAALACGSAAALFDGESAGVSHEGLALLVAAGAHFLLGAAFFARLRDFAALFLALGVVILAVATAELLGGGWLALAWAGEAAVLAWLGRATGESRFRLPAAAYLALALGYAVGHLAPPSSLFEPTAHPAAGAPSLLAVAAGSLLVWWFTRAPAQARGNPGPGAAFLDDLVATLHRARAAFVWLAGALVLYAASLALLELSLFIAVDGDSVRFERGHVAVSALWALTALALVEAGGRLRRLDVSTGGLVLLGLALAETVAFDWAELEGRRASFSFLLVAAGALLAGFEHERFRAAAADSRRPEALVAVAVSALLGAAAVEELGSGSWHGIDVVGGGLVLLALPYAALAATAFRTDGMRDLVTVLWSLALGLAGAAALVLLDGVWLVLALSVAAAALSVLAVRVGEIRFQAASAAFLLVAAGHALALEAPPRDLVVAAEHPAEGAAAIVLVALSAVVFGLCARHEALAERPPFSWSGPITLAGFLGALGSWQASYRRLAHAGAGVLALYALSLGILELTLLVSPGSVETDFQRGHTVVSAVWGAVGLALLTLGLVRRSRALRLAGFALFGVSLAKLFLYDLAFLSSVARALSFLVVGVLLLAGGFFYQRLDDRLEERDRADRRPAVR
ncbi:MAG TPA: DUF2339 domain-containing protein [Gaiellaceae bacterium]|nr:DUF2339 domain-containing protein [Gaiellaceae bacterium]